MADVFFSYSSADRDRVRLLFNALDARQIPLFWDQTLPPGQNWDEWIRTHLGRAKIVLVFWSHTSINSRNVRDEANIAKLNNKLIPALLDDIPDGSLPLGLGNTQCANLIDWKGDLEDNNWTALASEIENRLIPLFARLRIDQAERRAESINERALRATASEREDRAGLLATLREAEQKLSSTRLEADHYKTRNEAIEKQIASEREEKEKSDQDYRQIVAGKDVEIGLLLSKSDSAAAETIQQLKREVCTLQLANEALRQRPYPDAEEIARKGAGETALAALRGQVLDAEADRRAATDALDVAHKEIAVLNKAILSSEESKLQEVFVLTENFQRLERETHDVRHRSSEFGRRDRVVVRAPRSVIVAIAIATLSTSIMIGFWYGHADISKESSALRAFNERLVREVAGLKAGAQSSSKIYESRIAALNDENRMLKQKGAGGVGTLTSPEPKLKSPKEKEKAMVSPYGSVTYSSAIGSERTSEAASLRLSELIESHLELPELRQVGIKMVDLGERGVWYQLRFGSYPSIEQARESCRRLQSRGIKVCWAVTQ